MPSQQVFPVFLGNGKSFISNKIFSCSLILGASVHQKNVQIRPTVLTLKLDKGMGTFLPIFLTISILTNFGMV